MSDPGEEDLIDVVEATWPAAASWRVGPWVMRDGAGGGKRVSSATFAGSEPSQSDIRLAEEEFSRVGQPPLFMLRHRDLALDSLLAERDYPLVDPVTLYACPIEELTAAPLPPVSAFSVWPPLAIMRDLWARGGIGRQRLAVMERAKCAKTGILARNSDRPAGVCFVGVHRAVAMVHALEVLPDFRRRGVGQNIIRAAAFWAQKNGARHMSLVVTDANTAANALYRRMNMVPVGHYHYRMMQTPVRGENDQQE